MSDEQDVVLSDEALAAQEKEAGAEGDDLRAKVVAELGLEDNDANKELIDKLVTREGGLRKGFGKLLGDYKKLRDTKKPSAPAAAAPTAKKKDESVLSPDEIRKQTQESTRAALDEEFLDESDYSDTIKDLIRQEAKRSGISARKAAKSEFILFKLDQEKKAQAADEAAKNGSRKGKTVTSVDTSKPLDPADYDLSTEEGRKGWEAAKKAHADARKK